MKILMTLVEEKKLTHEVFDSLLASDFKKAGKRDISDQKDYCGQEFPDG